MKLSTIFLIMIGVGLLALLTAFLTSKLNNYSYKAKDILTVNEQEFFHRLRRALPDHYIFPQVAFSALLEPVARTQKAWRQAFFSISSKRVDYAIYDSDLSLIAIVELDDKTHNVAKDRERDAKFASAGIRTVRFESRNRPGEGRIRELVLPAPEQKNAT